MTCSTRLSNRSALFLLIYSPKVLRQTLKTAVRHRWLDRLPDLSEPYRASGKIAHRAWFSPEEYKQLYEATRERLRHPKNARYKWESEQLHDYVLFMANTGLRPDEANRLEYRDVKITADEGSNQTILEIEVRGKRGVGYPVGPAGIESKLRDRLRKLAWLHAMIESQAHVMCKFDRLRALDERGNSNQTAITKADNIALP